MNLIKKIKKLIALDNPFRIFYHHIRAVLASVVFMFPSKNMIIIGVTGTDGKTTTCSMIASILKEAGYKAGIISTVYVSIGDSVKMNTNKMSSLDPFVMNRYLYAMKKAGCKYVVLEVTSHALFYNRVWGVNFDVAVLTNISSDHLDLHKTVKAYASTKKKLFTSLNYFSRKPHIPKVIVLNQDDSFFEEFNMIITDKKYVYSTKNKADIVGMNIVSTSISTTFQAVLSNVSESITLPLPGSFNVYNALAAISVAISQHIPLAVVKKALEQFAGVPGRMERIQEGQPFTVIVDYAHTENALKKVLSVLKPITQGKILLVFGATGDRDKTKRPFMGKIASQYADMIFLTDDDPYTEDRMAIIKNVAQGITKKENENFWIIPDRESAVKTAIYLAQDNDIVLITGKGAEQIQVTNEGKIPYDDRETARKYVRERYKM